MTSAGAGRRSRTGASRRRAAVLAAALVAGMVALGFSLANADPGSTGFYVATAALAAIWIAGALLARPGPTGRLDAAGGPRWRRVSEPFAAGLALAVVFIVGALVVRQVDALADATDDVLDYARRGSGPLVVMLTATTAVAEELFFRGALYDALPSRLAAVLSTAVYVVATLASGSAMLAFAALVVGAALALQRRRAGGFAAPMITHVTWSLAMLLVLPALIDVG